MNANMKVECRIAASKGNHVLGMIRRNITYLRKEFDCTTVYSNS